VQTVEHLLAAAAALCLDDLLVELDGPEPPIGDGSFQPYLTALQAAGVADQAGEPVVYRVTAPFHLVEGDSTYVVAPAPSLRLTTTIEWAHPLIGRQSGCYDITPDGFARELAGARTFGFLREAEMLRARGLALGASVFAGLLSELQLREMSAVGGLLIIGVGLKLLSIRDVKVADYLPAILVAPLLVAAVVRIKEALAL